MKNQSMLALVACLIGSLGSSTLSANTKTTAEGVGVGNLAHTIRDYKMIFGRPPTNWNEIVLYRGSQGLDSSMIPLVQTYVFVGSLKIPSPQVVTGYVHVVRAAPTSGDGHAEEGRYLISVAGDEALSTWVSEAQVQRLLASFGIRNLPTPEGILAVPSGGWSIPIGVLVLLGVALVIGVLTTLAIRLAEKRPQGQNEAKNGSD